MAIQDNQLVQWLGHELVSVRNAALELLSSSFSSSNHWCQSVLKSWDQFGPANAFPEFPLLTHFDIPHELVPECLERAGQLSSGKPLTDRACRCAGKLVEAISVSSPSHFRDHLDSIQRLKASSKIFFRIDFDQLTYRVEQLTKPNMEPLADWFARPIEPTLPYGIYPLLEASFVRGEADEALRVGFGNLNDPQSNSHVIEACFELATRYRLLGHEQFFADNLDDENASIADACAIALARCRNDSVLSLIADRFASYSRAGQLRSLDVLRRVRLPKTPQLIHFLAPHAAGSTVQNALKVAEILQFDFSRLEDWLEALMVVEDPLFARISSQLAIVYPLSESLEVDDRKRTIHLLETRRKRDSA